MSTGAISQGCDKHMIYVLNVRESVPHKDTSYTLKTKSQKGSLFLIQYVTSKKVDFMRHTLSEIGYMRYTSTAVY